MKSIDIRHLSKLANIELDKKEEKKLQKDLDAIIKHIQKIHEVDTKGLPETIHPNLTSLMLRNDKVGKSLSRDVVLLNKENSKDGYFTVERLIYDDNQ